MLVGCLLRHFKVYENIMFAPIGLGGESRLSVFTGGNGVGKSSILEAIDHFFHQSGWIINNNAKRTEAYIAPLFLIKKDSFESDLSSDLLDCISEYFWKVDETANATISKNVELQAFLEYRDKLAANYSNTDYYLFLSALKYPNDDGGFATFGSDLKSHLIDKLGSHDGIENLGSYIRNHYSYIYIPVESSTNEVLRLESFELQELMDKDVLDEIDGILNNKIDVPRESLGLSKGPKIVKFSPLKHINDKLDEFILSANESIQKLGEKYEFSTDRHQKKKLSVQDIREQILSEYFAKRTLRKDGKLIENLSSGEQRIALFDIAYSILSQGKNTKRELILAIDEPESSMHVSQCYKQFIRLSEISDIYKHQVIITTHWYGFLPVIERGYINHVDTNESGSNISQYNLRHITSERKSLPDDISFKSMLDLISSIVGMMRSEETNWLVCEGVDDQRYLSLFLDGKVNNLRVLPVGGIDNVVKVYNYLHVALSEKSEGKSLKGRVVCLTDTDHRPVNPTNFKSIKGLLTLRRLNLKGDDLSLVELNPNTERYITVLEDVLDAELFFEACKDAVNRYGSDENKELIDKLKLREDAKYTGFSYELKSIEGTCMDSHKNIGEISTLLSDHDIKFFLSERYFEHYKASSSTAPILADKIVELFET